MGRAQTSLAMVYRRLGVLTATRKRPNAEDPPNFHGPGTTFTEYEVHTVQYCMQGPRSSRILRTLG